MTNIEEIIEYIKSLKKGFDKELFQSKIDELAFVVDTTGMDYESFHTLFKIWLNLTIPITKWKNLGVCLVPSERISARTVEYSLRWLMANIENQADFHRTCFVLDWLTAAMDNDCIDMKSLDSGYEIFYTMISYEALTAHCMKLIYTLTKPVDVTRRRVIELLDYAKKREGKKNMYRQLQVLLGLFKSYKPECVPENVPSISIHTSFKAINTDLVNRFKSCQSQRNCSGTDQQRLFWSNPINSSTSRNKKADPLVPNMEFLNIGSKQYTNDIHTKTYLDFSDAASLVRGAVATSLRRPARLRALLCNAAGMALLALAPAADHAFLSHDLHHLLTSSFLEASPYSYIERQDMLCRLSVLQQTLMQGIPVVTRFLAQYLHFWNESDFFAEILELVEWVNVDSIEHVTAIVDSLARAYCRSRPLEQCAVARALTTMYDNIVYTSKRSQLYFMSMKPSDIDFAQILSLVGAKLTDMCDKGMQINPDDLRAVRSGARAARRVAAAGAGARAARLALALPLLGVSAALLDDAAALILLYKRIFAEIKQKSGKSPHLNEQKQILKAYTFDLINCFYEECLSGRDRGLVFAALPPPLVARLRRAVPRADAALALGSHPALAPYTQAPLRAAAGAGADDRLLFDAVVKQQFPDLSEFVLQAMAHLA